MKTYLLNSKGVHKFRQEFIRSAGIKAALVFGLALGTVLTFGAPSTELTYIRVGASAAGLFVVVWVALGIKARAKQQQPIWESIQVEMDANQIAWRQSNRPEMRVRREEVTSLIETTGGLLVRTLTLTRWILIPTDIDGFDEIKAQLLEWASLRRYTQSERIRSTAIMIGLGGCVILSLVLQAPMFILALVLVALAGYGLIYLLAYRA